MMKKHMINADVVSVDIQITRSAWPTCSEPLFAHLMSSLLEFLMPYWHPDLFREAIFV